MRDVRIHQTVNNLFACQSKQWEFLIQKSECPYLAIKNQEIGGCSLSLKALLADWVVLRMKSWDVVHAVLESAPLIDGVWRGIGKGKNIGMDQ